ncbi:MAG: hypothetical protein DMF64_11060 [Acidobacteria bacterium]|nr:MAG: hypothetical protein DMF64_11060 [Acidobacteriota bacterium]
MRIEIEQLTEAGTPFAHTYTPDELALEDERARLRAEARVVGRASRKRQRAHVRGTIETELEIACDRCLAPLAVPVKAEFDVSYDPPGVEAETDSAELQAEDLDTTVYTGESLDLDELVREQILLALPTRSLCREACQGLCPTCGVNLNTQTCKCEQKEIDPRWAGLAALKKSSDE